MNKLTDTVGFRKLRGGNTKNHSARSAGGFFEAKVQRYKQDLESYLDHNAQHGTVKVLWKDGKPVSPLT